MRTKAERIELEKQGISIIRPRYNHTKKAWQIAKNTAKGGWVVISNIYYPTQAEAEKIIKYMVRTNPDQYITD